MKKIRIGLNGLGRIGRTIFRELYRQQSNGLLSNIEIVAINNPGDMKSYAHLLEHDSVHRHFNLQAEYNGNNLLLVNNKDQIPTYGQVSPKEIPWSKHNVDIVIDCTGVFRDQDSLKQHLGETVKKVILCAPGKKIDSTIVMGINEKTFNPSTHHIISNASCTTNCLAPLAKVLNDNFQIESGMMTTVHSYTSDQNLLDNSHDDLRRSRAAALSMIPTTTGAAKALGEVLPELAGKLDGYSVRVPTPDVSLVDLTVMLTKTVTIADVNNAMKEASLSHLKNILAYTEKELVSIDYMGRPESSIFDAPLTNVVGKMVKVVSWYDNEVGFSNRVLDLTSYVGKQTWG